MSYHLLTSEEEKRVKKLSNDFYHSIDKDSYSTSERLFGIEVEFSVVDDQYQLKPGLADDISSSLSDYPIVPELGSYQIEINPSPISFNDSSFHRLYDIIQKAREKLVQESQKRNVRVIPVGLPFYLDSDFFKNNISIFTQKNRYLVSAEYFGGFNKNGTQVLYRAGGGFELPGDAGVTVINELHVQVQALNCTDLMNLFNYSQLITAPIVALGANSGICNGKQLEHIEEQINIFQKSEGVYDGATGIPRVGLFPGYMNSLDDFFNIALSFKPLYLPTNDKGATAFDLMLGIYYGWTRIRYGLTPSPHFRIEFRPLSTQPTMIENIALSELYVKSLFALMQSKTPLIPKEFLLSNFDESIKKGMDAQLHWNMGAGVDIYSVKDIMESILTKIEHSEFLHVIKERIIKNQCPSDRLILDTNEVGYDSAIEKYMECFAKEIPYI